MFGAEFSFTLRSEKSLLTDPEKKYRKFPKFIIPKKFYDYCWTGGGSGQTSPIVLCQRKKIATWSSVGNFIFLPGTRFSIQELNSNVRPKIATLVAKGPTYFASSKGD